MSESTAPAGNAADTSQEALKLVICCWKNFGADNKVNAPNIDEDSQETADLARSTSKPSPTSLRSPARQPRTNTATATPAASQDPSAAAAPTPAKRKRATKATAGAGEGKTKRSKSVAVPVKENDEDPFVEQNAGKKEPEEETKE
ncbi:uncharacterized protein VDAG_08899 [Verticillium dahliae VdLs.17]|uniref:Uncharacterized protein n=1 Tax=Verticillium dahliae (strain VdLs.17 / ATCC MYA-4575 / FGSC 10137) TaxID=498257 RepID=G2XGB2_VERDV|nr:uncharacterized protein VDAG_08899 [Verticillium dahliae VdLs.17]EGY18739.1 hypothetical protein VDAG_08899 [Verticillium dahliae VdLs.17]